MKAFVLEKITEAKDVTLAKIPVPKVQPGWVLVKVKAFGLNHSEQILRQSEIEADYIKKPVIPGIECVGEIADASDSDFTVGQRVVALMGGMGRSFDGSYAEYALLPTHHVFAIASDLDWASLAAVPETYYTAWGSLFASLKLQPDDVLLIRGATCALGYASIRLAKAYGCRVIATTHREKKLSLLSEADEAVLDDRPLEGRVTGVTKALELIGPKTLRDTMRTLLNGGIVCQTGVLGGVFHLNGFEPISEIPNGVYLTSFHSNSPTKTDIDAIFGFLGEKGLTPDVGAVYEFAELKEALIAQDEGKVNGKIVVRVSN